MIYNRDTTLFHHSVCCNDTEYKIIQINETKKILYKDSLLFQKILISMYIKF
jgi:hypothetical protein